MFNEHCYCKDEELSFGNSKNYTNYKSQGCCFCYTVLTHQNKYDACNQGKFNRGTFLGNVKENELLNKVFYCWTEGIFLEDDYDVAKLHLQHDDCFIDAYSKKEWENLQFKKIEKEIKKIKTKIAILHEDIKEGINNA